MNQRRARMGRGGAWLLVVGGALAGCVLPQDDQVLPNLPLVRNTPPTLVFESATPARRGATILLGDGCKDFPFRIAVVDPDQGDTIRSLWFVDHDERFSTFALPGTAATPRLVSPLSSFYSAAGGLRNANPQGRNEHYVTVVVGDREFLPGGIDLRLAELPLPDGGTVTEFSRTAQYTWDVVVDPITPCPN